MKSNRRVRPSLEEVCCELVGALISRWQTREGRNYEFGYACMLLGDQADEWQSEPHRWIVLMACAQLEMWP